MFSALVMFRRFARALRHAAREKDLLPLLSAAAVLVLVGTVTYSVREGWSLVDGFYFAVATLTTSSVADPDLVLDDTWMKVFTPFYILSGIGILVEIARRIGFAFVELRQRETSERAGETPRG